MNDYYIDLSYQNSSELLKNDEILNLYEENFKNNSNLNKKGDLIEGFGNFGRVNLEKCCPLEYMWSENQKKCVKICDSCAVGAYGNINYEFLQNHGNEFMTFMTCKGDATGAYDFDKINRRYGYSELITQHHLNHHIDTDPNASGVQPSEENPWADVASKVMYQVSSKQKQMNIRETGRWAHDDDTWNTYLDCNASGECVQRSGSFTRITDTQRYDIQSGTLSQVQANIQNIISTNRRNICNASNTLQVNNIEDDEISASYLLCNTDGPIINGWNNLCGLSSYDNLDLNNICGIEGIENICDDNNVDITKICINSR
jgi:hypothetical protein